MLSLVMDAAKSTQLKFEIIPTTLAVRKLEPNYILLQFSAERGFAYRIHNSTNLNNWTLARDIAETYGPVDSIFFADSPEPVFYWLEQIANDSGPFGLLIWKRGF